MMLIIFEIKKIFKSRLLIIALVLFAVIDIYKIHQQFKEYGRDNSLFNQQYFSYYAELRGTITSEKIHFVVEQYRYYKSKVDSGNYSEEYDIDNTITGYEYSDMNLFRELYEQMNYAYNYGNNLASIIKRADLERAFFDKKNNKYEKRKNRNILKIYRGRRIKDFYDVSGINTYLNYDFSSLLLIILLILGISGIISNERQCGMDVILKVSLLGKKKLLYAKLATVLIFTFFIGLFMYIVDFGGYFFLFKLDGFGNPLFSIADFKFTPFNGSILNFIILNTLSKLFGLVIVALLITFISSFSSNQLISITVSSLIVTLLLCIDIIDLGEIGRIIGLVNPINMLSLRDYTKEYSTGNIFNYPVQKAFIIAILNVFAAITLYISIILKNISSSN